MKVKGSDSTKSFAALLQWMVPPATVSFFTGAPGDRSRPASVTQKVLGLVQQRLARKLFEICGLVCCAPAEAARLRHPDDLQALTWLRSPATPARLTPRGRSGQVYTEERER